MGMAEVLGYVASMLVGVSLGLIGGGGSILTVPVLVFLFGVAATDATAYSLFVVGTTALVATVDQARRGMVDYRVALGFALPSVAGVYVMRRVAIPSLPNNLFHLGSIEVTKDRAILVLFGLLMLTASFSMIRGRSVQPDEAAKPPDGPRLAAHGLATGLVTGSVGAGGGFLIVPALVLVAKMPMKRAVAASLLVIAINSLLGFAGDLQTGRAVDWALLGSVVSLAVIGSFVGGYLGRYVSGAKLKPAFGYFVLVMGLFLIGSEVAKGGSASPEARPAEHQRQDNLRFNNHRQSGLNLPIHGSVALH